MAGDSAQAPSMAVTEQTTRNVSTAAAGATVFPYGFKITNQDQVLVQVNGDERQLGVHYDVTGVGQESGGDIVFVSPLSGGETVMRRRNMRLERSTDYQNLGDLRSPTLNNDQDDPVMMLQQVADDVSRSLKLPPSSTGSGDISRMEPLAPLVISADGNGVEPGSTELTGDMLLRPNLAEGSAGKGAELVAYRQGFPGAVTRKVSDRLATSLTVNDFGARGDGVTNSRGALLSYNAVVGSAVVKFEPTVGGIGLYDFSGTQNSDFNGKELDLPDRATLSLDSSDYGRLKNSRFTRQSRVFFKDLSFDYYPQGRRAEQRDKQNFIGVGDLRMQRLRAVAPNSALRFLSIPINSSDTFATDSPTVSDAGQYSYSGKATGSWYGGFIQLRRGETYSCAVNKAGLGAIGVMFRHTGGYSVLYADPTSPSTALMSRGIKATGGTIATAQDVSFPGRGSYTSYDPSRALWGVTILDNGRALVTLNGRAITQPVWATGLGDIYEVGFVWQPVAAGASASFADTMIERNTDPLGRAELPEIRIFGDSTSDYLTGMWQDDLKDMLDHTFGMKLGAISNLALSGTNSFDVYQKINSEGLGGAYYVVVSIGTNDIQSGASVTTFSNNITGILTAIQAAGRVPVMVMPYMWYGRAQIASGSRGQPSTNYDAGAPYRAKLARLCADAGAILVDPTRELPEPKPSYITADTAQDPLVRDNIHQSYLGYKLYAWAISRAIASHAAQRADFKDYRIEVPADWMRSSWTRGTSLKVAITDTGLVSLQGNIGAGTAANGTVVMNLPRWARPEVTQSFVVWTNAGIGELRIGTNGDVTIDNVGSPFNTVHLNNARFYAGD